MPIKKAKQRNFQVLAFRYGDLVEFDEDDTPYAETLDEAIELARRQEFHGGKFTYKVFDKDDKVVADIRDPYEGARINVMEHDWLGDIQADYSIDDETFRKAIDYWLEQQKASENATN